MLVNNMPLRKMIDFKPSDEDMAMLPLDVVLYIKVSLVGVKKEDNYEFIRYFFSDEEISEYLKDLAKTVIYDFDGTNTNQSKFITIFELYGLKNYNLTSDYLKTILEFYNHDTDVLIDIYTHDNKEYRLSNLDGIVKLEEMNIKED